MSFHHFPSDFVYWDKVENHNEIKNHLLPIILKKNEENKIFWKNNSGYDKPVVCEHVALHANLNLENYKIYIEPKLMVRR